MRGLAIICCFVLLAVGLQGQSRQRGANPNTGASQNEPHPTFHGTFHSAAKGMLYVNTEDGNQMEFWVSRKTEFLDGEKKIKVDDLKQGTAVSVVAKRVVATRMDAVSVRVERAKPAQQ